MKHLKILIGLFISLISLSITNWYFFGLKSADNTISNITDIESKYWFDIPIVWFIFDNVNGDTLYTIQIFKDYLWTGRIYHITISPKSYSAKEVAEGKFDTEYKKLFKIVKDDDLKVIFRTMHEMNWGRYPRWSNPEYFKQAWIHVRELSRKMWLDQSNILFDMSVNHRDMPTKRTPSQSASLITCDQNSKYKTITHQTFVKTGYKTETVTKKVAIQQTALEKLMNKPVQYKNVTETKTVAYPIYKTSTEQVQNCYTFEDYYPWDEYVDIMWVTFYNRWKATYGRQRYSPDRILNDPAWNTLYRLEKFDKPIFVDEVWTTAVRYTWSYDFAKSQEVYKNNYDDKNNWLNSLRDFLLVNNSIWWALYFNVDYTNWLQNWTAWEADWSVININNWKYYESISGLFSNQESSKNLFSLFGLYIDEDDNYYNPNDTVNTFNTSKFTNTQISELVELLIFKFWKEDALKKVNDILNISTNDDVTSLLNSLIYALESK